MKEEKSHTHKLASYFSIYISLLYIIRIPGVARISSLETEFFSMSDWVDETFTEVPSGTDTETCSLLSRLIQPQLQELLEVSVSSSLSFPQWIEVSLWVDRSRSISIFTFPLSTNTPHWCPYKSTKVRLPKLCTWPSFRNYLTINVALPLCLLDQLVLRMLVRENPEWKLQNKMWWKQKYMAVTCLKPDIKIDEYVESSFDLFL